MESGEQKIEESVAAWLAEEGYRLEYLTHKAFHDAGIRANLSHYVEMPEGKWREIDVSAYQWLEGREPPTLVRVLCECKYSKDKPWILLHSGLRANLFADWSSTPQARHLHELSAHIHRYEDALQKCWHFAKDQPFAHNIVQAFKKKNRDVAFDSLQKIANASWDSVETPQRRGHVANLVAFPCLVVEAPLLLSWFDHEANRFAVKEVPCGRLSWSGCRGGTLVDVIHVSALNEYASAMKLTFATVLEVVTDLVRTQGSG